MNSIKIFRLISLVTLFSFQCYIASAQAASGYIRYEEKFDQHKQLPPSMAAMKNNIPQFSTTVYRMYFNPTESIYKGYFEDRTVNPPGFGGSPAMRANYVSVNLNNQYYTNDQLLSTQLEFLGKSYIINDTIKFPNWKFGNDKRTILDYECNLAYYTDNSNPEKPLEISAWYSPKIRGFVGPERYNTLPGGILALDINGGEHYWVARKVELRDLTAEEKITPPEPKKSTKKITYKQYKDMQDEQTKKMRERAAGSGGVIIIGR